MFDIYVDISSLSQILKNHGLEPSGSVQRWLTSEVMRISDPYVPADEAMVLKATAYLTEDGEAIVYGSHEAPYARYHWYGKLMVDPNTGSSYAKRYVKKVLTDRDMKYRGAPLRGSRWVERAWIDNKDAIIKSTEEHIK